MMKIQEKQEAEKLKELLAQAEGHPMMKAIMVEKAAEVLSARKAAAEAIESLRKEQGEVIPKLRADLAGKEAKYLKAKAALDALFAECRTARATLSSEGQSFDTAIRQQETILIESADPKIQEAVQFFRDKLDDLRKPGRISSRGMNVERNLITDTQTVTVESNAQAIKDALLYCQGAIKSLEQMKLSPALDPEWIEELKAAIPCIDIFIETTGTKPIPGSKGINPRDLLKSDSQLDWEMGKLNEKFRKLMGKLF